MRKKKQKPTNKTDLYKWHTYAQTYVCKSHGKYSHENVNTTKEIEIIRKTKTIFKWKKRKHSQELKNTKKEK